MKTLKFIPLFLIALLLPLSALGQSTEDVLLEEEPGSGFVADTVTESVVVKDLQINSNSYSEGDTVTGSFTAYNNGDLFAQDLTYSIAIVSDFEAGLATKLHSTENFEEYFSLRKGAEQRVNFSYQLPKMFSGEYAVQVTLSYKSGAPLSWEDSMFSYQNISLDETQNIDIESAILKEGENSYSLGEGPTFADGEIPVLALGVQNNSNNPITVYAVTEYARFDKPDTYFGEERSGAINFLSLENKSIDLNLSKHNNEPEVYTAKVHLENEAGDVLTQSVIARYIIKGDIVTVYQLESDVSYLERGQDFNINLEYTGNPIDITDSDEGGASFYTGNLELTVYNERGDIVAEYKGTYENTDSRNEITVPLTANKKAQSLVAEAKFYNEEGELVENYTTEEINHTEAPEKQDDLLTIIITVVVLVVLLIIILMLIQKRKKQDQKFKFDAGVTMFMIFASATIFAMVPSNTEAAVIFDSEELTIEASYAGYDNRCQDEYGNYIACQQWGGEGVNTNLHDVISNVYLNDVDSATPGGSYTFSGYQVHAACANSAPAEYIFLKDDPGATVVTDDELVYQNTDFTTIQKLQTDGDWWRVKGQFAFDLTVPSEVGTYTDKIRFTVCNRNDYTKCGYREANVTYTVKQTEPEPGEDFSVSCVPSQAEVYIDETVTFTATAENGTTPYNYTFSDEDGGSQGSGSSNTYAVSFAKDGVKSVDVTAYDSSSPDLFEASDTCFVTVVDPLGLPEETGEDDPSDDGGGDPPGDNPDLPVGLPEGTSPGNGNISSDLNFLINPNIVDSSDNCYYTFTYNLGTSTCVLYRNGESYSGILEQGSVGVGSYFVGCGTGDQITAPYVFSERQVCSDTTTPIQQ